LDGNVSPDKFYDWQRRQQLLSLFEILSASKALQNFGQY
jgi:hypothetical protein